MQATTGGWEPGPCLHCKVKKRLARCSRGLCRYCWADPVVREQYPFKRNSFANKLETGWEDQDTYRCAPLPRNPTDAEPGSEEKIRVMQERLAKRRQLFHPLDVSDVTAIRTKAELGRQKQQENLQLNRPAGWTDTALQIADGRIWGGRRKKKKRRKRMRRPCPKDDPTGRLGSLFSRMLSPLRT